MEDDEKLAHVKAVSADYILFYLHETPSPPPKKFQVFPIVLTIAVFLADFYLACYNKYDVCIHMYYEHTIVECRSMSLVAC